MAQPIQAPPASPASAPAPAAKAPGIVQAFVAVLTKPASFYASVRDLGGFGAPLVFALVMGLVSGVIGAVFSVLGLTAAAGAMGGAVGAAAGFAGILMAPIFAIIGCFVGGAIVHVVSLIASGKGTYEQSVRVAGYAAAVMPIGALLGFVPLLNVLASLYGLYLVVQGLIAVHAADAKRTYVCAAVLAAILVLFTVLGLFAQRAAQEAFGEGSDFQREMQKAQVEMQRAAEEMKKAQQQQQK